MFKPRGTEQFGAATDWMVGLLTGGLAVGVCVLAVALVGFALLTGRLALRRGAMVVLGCFVLLGAPAIATVFLVAGRGDSQITVIEAPQVNERSPREELPTSNYNPYSGASLRRSSVD